MDGVMNMNKFDKMVECNRRISIEKIDLARKTILDMVEEGERVTVQRLMAQTGLSRGFFYKNPTVRKLVDEAAERQVVDLTSEREPCMVMDNEIANLHEKMRILRVEKLKEENQRLKKALDKKNRNILKNL